MFLTVEILYWFVLSFGLFWSFKYFADMGDITQLVFPVVRKRMVFTIRHETKIILTALFCLFAALYLNNRFSAGNDVVMDVAIGANILFLCFPYIWIHFGLRNQQKTARYYSIEEAKKFVRPKDSVIVIENNGHARAHPDYHIKRPHLTGTKEGLGGENVIMTYCCMTHLGLGFKTEIDNKPLDLTVVAQVGNNLIMRDKETNEPIQQVYGTRERDGRWSDHKMQQWPTYRMTFRGFQKAYPNGEVFLNPIEKFSKNPIACIFDNLVEAIILWGTVSHHTDESLMFETMDQKDDRLPLKELVWGFNVGLDSVAYDEDFILNNGGIVNAHVGGRDVIVAWDPKYESIGAFYNDTGKPIDQVDFWGNVGDNIQLERIETLKAEIYWCVWFNYFPETDLNRTTMTGHNMSD